TIVETMGRHTGWLAADGALAEDSDHSQSLIYIPEVPFQLDDCRNKVNEIHRQKRNSFIVVSERIRNRKCNLINEDNIEFDNLDRPKLGGVATYLQKAIEENTGISTRTITPSIWQRSRVLLSSKTDVDEAYDVGRKAWTYAKPGMTGVMIGIDRVPSGEEGYQVEYNPRKLHTAACQGIY